MKLNKIYWENRAQLSLEVAFELPSFYRFRDFSVRMNRQTDMAISNRRTWLDRQANDPDQECISRI